MSLNCSQAGQELTGIFRAGVAAVAPETAVHRAMSLGDGFLRVGRQQFPLTPATRLWLVGAGKAAGSMAAAAEAILGERLAGGLLVTKYGHGVPLQRCRLLEAGHPIPDAAGVAAADAILGLAAGLGNDDLLICLISGGGSALLPAPCEGISLAEKQRTTDLLLRAGADIVELNAVRKHLSRIKGGGLALAAAPARLATLAISDVIGDPPDVIASGPTVADASRFADALAVIERYGLSARLPQSVIDHLRAGLAGRVPETWKPSNTGEICYELVANNALACAAARDSAIARGCRAEIRTTALSGEASQVAEQLVTEALQRQQRLGPGSPPLCLVYGGETTVTVRGSGRGGRNQELALAAAIALDGTRGIALLAAGTDGNDGPTDAAGAIAEGTTLERSRQLGLDAHRALADNDSYNFFDKLGGLVVTGPTRTNVMDLTLLLVTPAAAAGPGQR